MNLQKRKASFLSEPVYVSPFLSQLEKQTTPDEVTFSRDCKEYFATSKAFSELGEMQRELGYSQLLLRKLKDKHQQQQWKKQKTQNPVGSSKAKKQKTK